MRNANTHTSEVRAEQATNAMHEAIYLGTDLHKKTIVITRIIDHANPQPAQRFSWEKFCPFVEKQLHLAKKVYLVYEAGAFGFWVARKLTSRGVECYVAHPEKLDPRSKGVQTDKWDSLHLAEEFGRLWRKVILILAPAPKVRPLIISVLCRRSNMLGSGDGKRTIRRRSGGIWSRRWGRRSRGNRSEGNRSGRRVWLTRINAWQRPTRFAEPIHLPLRPFR